MNTTLSQTGEPSRRSGLTRIVRSAGLGLALTLGLAAVAIPAGAASPPPTLTCSALAPACTSGFATVGQGYTGTIYFVGTGFADATNGTVAITTTAPGAAFTDVTESSSTAASATVTVPSATPAGFYSVTLTDANGTAVLPMGLGVNPGPQVLTTTGNAGEAGSAPSTINITGTGLSGSTVAFNGTGAPTITGSPTINSNGTMLSFVANNTNATAGTYTYTITGAPITGAAPGVYTGTYVVSANPGAPIITAINPDELAIPTSGGTVGNSTAGTVYTVTVTGTGFLPAATVTIDNPELGVVQTGSAYVNPTTLTATVVVNEYSVGTTPTAPAQLSVTVNNGNSLSTTANGALGIGEAPANTLAADPTIASFSPSTITAGSTAVPYTITGANFLPGAVVSIPAADGSVTTNVVAPSVITGTITIPASLAPGTVTLTVTNTSGGKGTTTFTTTPAPTITGTYAGLEGAKSNLVINGTGFVSGAVVSAGSQVATFGTAVTSNCTGTLCDTITVPVTYATFTGSTPIVTSLTVTNPGANGAATLANGLTVNPLPTVTGSYTVPSSTSPTEVVVNGTGFENGVAVASSNPAFTLSVANHTATTLTMLVSTTSAAPVGATSTITVTNPDSGSTTFSLTVGAVKALGPKITKVNVHRIPRGRTTKIAINGKNLTAASVMSDSSLIKVTQVISSTPTRIVVRLAVSAKARSTVYHFMVKTHVGSAKFGMSITRSRNK
jgi:hypothetical protein